MSDLEEKLQGGNVAASVLRIGTTVRKPATQATSSVQALLTYLDGMAATLLRKASDVSNGG